MNTGGTEEGGGREREDFKLVKTRPAMHKRLLTN